MALPVRAWCSRKITSWGCAD